MLASPFLTCLYLHMRTRRPQGYMRTRRLHMRTRPLHMRTRRLHMHMSPERVQFAYMLPCRSPHIHVHRFTRVCTTHTCTGAHMHTSVLSLGEHEHDTLSRCDLCWAQKPGIEPGHKLCLSRHQWAEFPKGSASRDSLQMPPVPPPPSSRRQVVRKDS